MAQPADPLPPEPAGGPGRLKRILLQVLRQGVAPGELAAAVALGLAVGVIPLMGTSTLLGVGAALALGLNQPAVQAANYLAYPLQLGLLLPFIRLGALIFHAPPQPLSIPRLVAGLRSDFPHTLAGCWTTLWHACVAWALVAPVGAVLLALLLRPVLARALSRLPGRGDAVP